MSAPPPTACRHCRRGYTEQLHHHAHGLCRPCYERSRRASRSEPDFVAVERACAGHWHGRLNVAERRIVVATLTRRGYSAAEIARRSGMAERTVCRWRARSAA